jgi:predicted enzyme related to lactoylglutathione lyase
MGAGEDVERPGRAAPHTFCWDELLTSNVAACAAFYSTIFGWSVETVETPGMTYTIFRRPGVKDETGADKHGAGMMQSPAGAKHPPFWLGYVAVPNADAAVGKAESLGATVATGPLDIPNVGPFAVLLDPEEAVIAVLASPA